MAFDREQLAGMTVNERLFETGQTDRFDAAVEAKDFNSVRSILESIFVDEASIRLKLESIAAR